MSGVGISLFAAIIGYFLSKRRERRQFVEQCRFEIYMKLMDLYGYYFWFVTKEQRGEKVPDDIRQKARELSWQIADLLRSADEIDYLEDVLDILFGLGFETAAMRHKSMDDLLDRLGKKVNPRYSRKIREISKANIKLLSSGGSSNAPGSFSP